MRTALLLATLLATAALATAQDAPDGDRAAKLAERTRLEAEARTLVRQQKLEDAVRILESYGRLQISSVQRTTSGCAGESGLTVKTTRTSR